MITQPHAKSRSDAATFEVGSQAVGTQPPSKSRPDAATQEVGTDTVSTQPPLKSRPDAATQEVGTYIVTADRDRGCWYLRSRSGLAKLTTDEFLADGQFSEFDLLLVEAAHLNPRSNPPQSKAQIYTAEQLAAWKPGCPVRTVKELHAAKRRAFFSIEGKADGADAEALYLWSSGIDQLADPELLRDMTRKFPFKPVPAWLVTIIQDMNVRQNACRVLDYQDDESQRVLPHFAKREGVELNPLRTSFSGTRFSEWKDKGSKARLNQAYVMAVYTALFTADGQLRLNDHGSPLGPRTVRRLLGLAGDAPRSVARGKIQHDLFASGLGRRSGHERAAHTRRAEYREYRKACETAILTLADIMRNEL